MTATSDIVARLNAALAGRYVVLNEVGAGGMATVYLADDLKHDRRVALKVLKPELAAVVGAERFLTEIKVTAGLQHPNILPLFDSGEADSFLFYVMPFIDGESLRDRLDSERQLPVAEAVRIAISVANALDHAHRRGVVHRDIKPANIMLQDGEPVVADFGIALAVGASQGRLTETGLSVGTPFYMSPEQATGDRVISPSSDTYSLACVLYELLAGEPPHGGGTAQAVLGRIIAGSPAPVRERRPTVPEHVDAALRKALERIPPDRFETAGAFAKALSDEGFRYGEAAAAHLAAPAMKKQRRITLGLAAVTAVALGVAGWALAGKASERPARVLTSELSLGPGAPDHVLNRAVISADGAVVVYFVTDELGVASIYVRRADELTARRVPGTEGARNVEISPSGDEVVFTSVAVGPLRVAELSGSGARTLAEGAQARPVWGPDHVYFTNAEFGISRVPHTGGEPERLTPDGAEGGFSYPNDVLPGGDAILLTRRGVEDGAVEIHVLSVASGETSLVARGSNAHYVDGLLIFAAPEGDRIMGAPFDPGSRRLSGPTVSLVSGLSNSGALQGALAFSLSESGDLVYPAGGTSSLSLTTPVWVDRSGAATAIDPSWQVSPVVALTGLDLSHDGTRLAVASQTGDGSIDLWVKDLREGPARRLTFDPPLNSRPFWGPDDDEIYYFHDPSGAYVEGHLLALPSDGSGRPREVLRDVGIGSGSWVGDEWMIFRVGVPARVSRDIYGLPAGESEPVELVATAATEQAPSLSPDGRWLLYQSDRSGEDNVWVRPFPAVDDYFVQISSSGGSEPQWAHSGDEIFYRDPQGRMVSAKVDVGTTLRVTETEVLFDATGYWSDRAAQQYDVEPGDRRFLMLQRLRASTRSLVVVWNWLDGVKERFAEEARIR